jgi:predicted CopG family antitoxin
MKENQDSRNRTIRWLRSIDEIAEKLAKEKNLKRGVSELFERLILAESKRKRGIAHLHAPERSVK